MFNNKYGKDISSRATQLELLILAMVGATLGSLQVINFVFLNVNALKTPAQFFLDWLFSMSIITLLVHFSFHEIRKVQEELIEKSEIADKAQRRLQHIIENTGETILVINPDGKVKFTSRTIEDLTGYTMSEMATMCLDNILHAEYKPVVKSELSDYKKLCGRHLFVSLLRKDGRAVPVEMSFMKIEADEKGQLIQCLARECAHPGDAGKAVNDSQHSLENVPLTPIAYGRLKNDYAELGNIFHRIMLAHDPITALHQMRLAALIERVGLELGMETKRIEWLKLGALLHDVGKLVIPHHILNKTGKLSEAEFAVVRLHSGRGIELLGNASLPPIVTDMILHHHERLDGSGYPHGLWSGYLTTETRILSVCDVADSMVSNRSYRQALDSDEVVEELRKGKGIIFDNEVVECVLNIIEHGAFNPVVKDDKELLKVV